MRKSLIMNDEGVVTGEEVGEDLGHTDSGYVAVSYFGVLVSTNTDCTFSQYVALSCMLMSTGSRSTTV